VYACVSQTSCPFGAAFSGSATSATITGLAPGTSYLPLVIAYNAAGMGAWAWGSPVVTAAVPSVPLNASATENGNIATVSWSAPTSNGGLPVTNYGVWAYPGDGTAASLQMVCPSACSNPATSLTLAPLTAGVSYYFVVYAYNAVGWSASGATTNSVPMAPSAPTGVTAIAGNATATVTWAASTAQGTPVTGYIVTSSPGGVTATAGSSATSAVVSPLPNGTPVSFTVVATSASGNSPPRQRRLR
jgi:hypothetical protein